MHSFAHTARERTSDTVNGRAIDWRRARELAEVIGRKIPVVTSFDRRQFFRYAALATSALSEEWLLTTLDDVAADRSSDAPIQERFFYALRRSAEQVWRLNLPQLAQTIEVPPAIWQTTTLTTATRLEERQLGKRPRS